MVFAVAYELHKQQKESGKPIPIRQASVSEPGGKVRMVTTGPWWLTVIQMPLAHIARELLGFHPSAHSCLLRCDQAWQALKVLERSSMMTFWPDYQALSSDLKSATDAIPQKLCRTLLRGFLEAAKLTEWAWLIDIVDLRYVFCEDGTSFILRRGIMMGEPLSKVCLVLLGLAVEEIAFSDYMGLSLRRPYTPRFKGSWRAFHLGGDDHLAIGPKGYLNQITAIHRSFGSVISPEKHRKSVRFSVYTEKILLWEGCRINCPVSSVTSGDSPFIDSVKVRLLSSFTKATDSANDKNIAIGKCKGLARTLEYFGNQSMKRLVLDRASYRFHDFIKGPHHRTISSVVALPISLGGLGLGIDTRYLARLPGCFNQAIRAVTKGGSLGQRCKMQLGRIFANTDPRGLQITDFVNDLVNQVLDYPDMVNLMSRNDALDQVDPKRANTFAYNLWLLAKKDIIPLGDIHKVAERPFLFRKLLEQERPGKYFRTEAITRRLAKCWDELEKLELGDFLRDPLSEEELKEAIRSSKMIAFVDLTQSTSIALADTANEAWDPEDPWLAADFRDVSLKEMLTYGEPSMTVRLYSTSK